MEFPRADPRIKKCVVYETPCCIVLHVLLVCKKSRNQGAGTQMLEILKEYAFEKQKPIRVLAEPEDEDDLARLLKFYTRAGFQPDESDETCLYYYPPLC